jgi:hypothetical protein
LSTLQAEVCYIVARRSGVVRPEWQANDDLPERVSNIRLSGRGDLLVLHGRLP